MDKRVFSLKGSWHQKVWANRGKAGWLALAVTVGCVVGWLFWSVWRVTFLPTSCSGSVSKGSDGSQVYVGEAYSFAFRPTGQMPWRLFKNETESRTDDCALVTYPQDWQDTEPWRSLPLQAQDWLDQRFPPAKVDPSSLFRVIIKKPDGATLDEIAAMYQKNWNLPVNRGRGGSAVAARSVMTVSKRQVDGVEALVTSGTIDMAYQPMYIYSELVTVLYKGQECTFNWQVSSKVSPKARDTYVAKHQDEVEAMVDSIKFLQ